MKIDLDYANALKLLVLESQRVNLMLVGCGGTGSWLAPAVARVGKLLIDRFHKDVSIYFMDPDKVEEKNCYRQNFCQAEIGEYKSVALADRYGLAWGLEIAAYTEPYRPLGLGDLAVIIGCVDNARARRDISDNLRDGTWWLDAGNTKNNGQILLGCGRSHWFKTDFQLSGFCGWLPAPHLQHPELIEEEGPSPAAEVNLSCAEMAMQDSQGLAINQRMAAEAADYLVRMLITKDLRKYATYIDLKSGTCRSMYISQKAVRSVGK